MKDRIEPLIAERAPWLMQSGWLIRSARRVLDHVLSYDAAVDFATDLQHTSARRIMDMAAARLAKTVDVSGTKHIPRAGPALIVANHPTGIGDGIMLWHEIAAQRPDAFFYANSDILRMLPQMEDLICPVEWRVDKRTHAKTRATMAYTRRAFESGRLGVIFPSGRLAKRRKLTLHERPWMTSAATLARKFDLPVIPVNIQARNSYIFYLFDLLHPTLRDITLFHETLNKERQPFRITIGRALPPHALSADAFEATQTLRDAVLRAGDPDISPAVVQKSSHVRWLRAQLKGHV